jgi:hypothetical protein
MDTQDAVLEIPVASSAVARPQTAFALAIFLSAFLLFQVQLIVAKQLLPWFGGTAGVWNTCLVFFQLLLLAGYGYAHAIMARLTKPRLVRTHIAMLAASVALLAVFAFYGRSPIYPSDNLRPETVTSPVWHILMLLSVSVGLPFFLLSTTGPLLQAWFTHTHRGTSPYKLYALSNLGSLLGLLSYPLFFEPNLSLRNQGRAWALAYLLYVSVCVLCALSFAQTTGEDEVGLTVGQDDGIADVKPQRGQRLLWFGLASCGCVMLLAVTNLICQEIAVVPFLWVLPLSIYLLSFVLCFHEKPLYLRGLFHVAFALAAVWGGIEFLQGNRVRVLAQIGWFGLLLFVACMVFHGELANLKPSPPHLTSFYLHIAAGGAFGTVLVGLVAPHIFPSTWEFQVGLWISGLVVAVVLWRDRNSWLYSHPRWLASAVVLAVLGAADYIGVSVTILHTDPVYLHVLLGASAVVTLVLIAVGPRTPGRRPILLQMGVLCGWCLFGMLFWLQVHREFNRAVLISRNFYGVLRVEYDQPIPEHHALLEKHGLTLHGAQLQAPGSRRKPTLYYGPSSAIGLLMLNRPATEGATSSENRRLRIGVVGLGVGTLAAYGQPGDYMRFYEMNPEVVRLAKGEQAAFSFLADTAADTDVVLGDGRISLERELAAGTPQKFDVLAIDAFSSDSIPMHLLTGEAMKIYLGHLRNDRSILAFHISNRSLDLSPVLAGLAEQYRLGLVRVLSLTPEGEAEIPSDWILMAADPAALKTPALLQHAKPLQLSRSATLWTDDYSNLLHVLR